MLNSSHNEPVLLEDEHRYLAFGIPSLDRLIGAGKTPNDRAHTGFALSSKGGPAESATFCIIGPDGTGKSVFALHFASEYWRRTWKKGRRSKIIYASSDLSHERAQKVWRSFWLDRPISRYRRIPFEDNGGPGSGWLRPDNFQIPYLLWEPWEETSELLSLASYKPSASDAEYGESLGDYLLEQNEEAKKRIAFIDLQSTTSGDDWSFLHSLVAGLRHHEESDEPRHLLIIDAVEGLETMVGERDAFGQEQSRRSRIAQIVRAAAKKCHIVFVVEEPKDDERLPDVFVADVVVRLRSVLDRDYSHRTVELEKVRGQRHVRGQHDFGIRQNGSKTGPDFNPDDPAVGGPGAKWDDTLVCSPVDHRMAYIQVFPSLHYLTRDTVRLSRMPSPFENKDWRFAAFGIYQLDSMLWRPHDPEYRPQFPDGSDCERGFDVNSPQARRLLCIDYCRKPKNLRRRKPNCLSHLSDDELRDRVWFELIGLNPRSRPTPYAGFDYQGLPAGTITTLIGNDSTFKSQLARAFLSQCFRTRHVYRPTPGFNHLRIVVENEIDNLGGQGVAILLATYDTDRERLTADLRHHLIASPEPRPKPTQDEGLEERLIVRALKPHHLPSAVLVQIVQQLVEEAKRRLKDGLGDQFPKDDAKREARAKGRIRFVIDDWSTLLAMYPEVKRDPLILPYLTAYLRGEGVTSLILATRSGNPNEQSTEALEPDIRELRSMADQHLYTWHVPFFDERRVAITAQPSAIPGEGSLVRELRPARYVELPRDLMSRPEKDRRASEKGRADQRERFDNEALVVDPHFELYSGLPDGRPVPVPLRVHLYSESEEFPAFRAYLQEIADLFIHLFGHGHTQTVLQPKYGASYEGLRELSYLQSEARLEHTLVIQVDEFWAESRSELLRQERYLFARTVDLADPQARNNATQKPIGTEDPFGLFSQSDATNERNGPTSAGRRHPSSGSSQQESHGTPLVPEHQPPTVGLQPALPAPNQMDPSLTNIVQTQARQPTDGTSRFSASQAVDMPDHEVQSPATGPRALPIRRYEFFDIIGYDFLRLGKRFPVDKVPYSWDFGFLICDRVWWDRARDLSDHRTTRIVVDGVPEKQSVGEIWDRLWKIDRRSRIFQVPQMALERSGVKWPYAKDDSTILTAWWDDFRSEKIRDQVLKNIVNPVFGEPGEIEPRRPDADEQSQERLNAKGVMEDRAVSWREFLGACKVVSSATRHEYVPFDVDLMATESFSCMVLEVWFSEVRQAWWYRSLQGDDWATGFRSSDYWPSERRDDLRGKGFKDILASKTEEGNLFRRALYRTMLLLNEVLGGYGHLDEDGCALAARPARSNSIAARHWYSTATIALKDPEINRCKAVVGMPGHFSVRGDWFLGVARGSRSPRLGQRAIDILCSRRANIVRLQSGLGLPVRDLFGTPTTPSCKEHRTEYWTNLSYIDDEVGRRPIPYRELRKLGAWDREDCLGRGGNFSWLWRSSIDHYDIHTRMWHRWLAKLLKDWRDWDVPVATNPAWIEARRGVYEWCTPVVLSSEQVGKSWWDGFAEYDHYLQIDNLYRLMQDKYIATQSPCFVEQERNTRWTKFESACDALIEGLHRVGNPPER